MGSEGIDTEQILALQRIQSEGLSLRRLQAMQSNHDLFLHSQVLSWEEVRAGYHTLAHFQKFLAAWARLLEHADHGADITDELRAFREDILPTGLSYLLMIANMVGETELDARYMESIVADAGNSKEINAPSKAAKKHWWRK